MSFTTFEEQAVDRARAARHTSVMTFLRISPEALGAGKMPAVCESVLAWEAGTCRPGKGKFG